MKLYILFGQRECRYDGEFAPEALEVVDEYTMDENPEWFKEKKKEYRSNSFFSSVKEIVVNVSEAEIDKILNGFPEVKGEIEQPSSQGGSEIEPDGNPLHIN